MSNLVVAGDISASWQQYIDVLNIIKNGIFAYLALYTGINSASVFGATPALGGVIGAVTMLTGMNPDAPISNIFTGEHYLQDKAELSVLFLPYGYYPC